MGSKLGFEMSLIIIEAIRGRCVNFMSGNGFGDIWWTDNPIYFSIIDYRHIAKDGVFAIINSLGKV